MFSSGAVFTIVSRKRLYCLKGLTNLNTYVLPNEGHNQGRKQIYEYGRSYSLENINAPRRTSCKIREIIDIFGRHHQRKNTIRVLAFEVLLYMHATNRMILEKEEKITNVI